jgi:predicted nucleic acid-binding protein
MNGSAADLFRLAEQGAVEVTTSDPVIAEVAFILTAKAHYQLAVSEAADRLSRLLKLRGVKFRDKVVVLEAFEVWETKPKLGFVDVLTASYAKQPGAELATFDRDFDEISGISRWQPPHLS